MKTSIWTIFLLLTLCGAAHAAATLATPPLRVDDDEIAACTPLNVGTRDVIVRTELYRSGSRVSQSGSRVLAPNQVGPGLSALETARNGAPYSCRFTIEKGNKRSVRAVVERRSQVGTEAALEAR